MKLTIQMLGHEMDVVYTAGEEVEVHALRNEDGTELTRAELMDLACGRMAEGLQESLTRVCEEMAADDQAEAALARAGV